MSNSQKQEHKLKQIIATKLQLLALVINVLLLPLSIVSLYKSGFNNVYLVHFGFICVMTAVYYRSEKRNYWLDSSVVVMFLTLVCVFAFYKFGFYSAFFGLIATAAIIIFALHSRLLAAVYVVSFMILMLSVYAVSISFEKPVVNFADVTLFQTHASQLPFISHTLLNVFIVLVCFSFLYIILSELRRRLTQSLIHLDEKNDQVDYLANHDHLTGLSSPRLAQEQLELTLNMAKRHDFKAAILYIDIDEFRLINEALGHDAGDYALKEVAKRIKELIRDTDIACRQGGDEFLIILHYPVSKEACDLICKRLIAAFDSRFPYQDHEIKINLSIGVAIFPEHGNSQFELRTKADRAMQMSKSNHKHHFTFAQ